MPRVKPKLKFGRNDVVVCWRTIGVGDDVHPDGVIKRGTRLRGNHPWVRMFPDAFILENTPRR